MSLHLLLWDRPAWVPLSGLRSLDLVGGMPLLSSGQAPLSQKNCLWLLLCPLTQGAREKPCTSPQKTDVLINSFLLEAEK